LAIERLLRYIFGAVYAGEPVPVPMVSELPGLVTQLSSLAVRYHIDPARLATFLSAELGQTGGCWSGQLGGAPTSAWDLRRARQGAADLLALLRQAIQDGVVTVSLPPKEPRRTDLNAAEQAVWMVLAKGPLEGPKIAKDAGYGYDYIRAVLARLVQRGVVAKCRAGYQRVE
jgi:hypothetical protein